MNGPCWDKEKGTLLMLTEVGYRGQKLLNFFGVKTVKLGAV